MDVGRRHVPDKFTAGFSLLDKFSKQWEQLQRVNERNANKATIAIDKLSCIDQSFTSRLRAIEDLATHYNSLSKLDEQIDNIGNDLKNLEKNFGLIEEQLLLLSIKNEQLKAEDLIRNIEGNHEAQVQQHKIRAEVRNDMLMSEHLRRVQSFEQEQQQALEERRRVLAKEFEEEKTRYLESNTKRP